jgi:hypothetical protein
MESTRRTSSTERHRPWAAMPALAMCVAGAPAAGRIETGRARVRVDRETAVVTFDPYQRARGRDSHRRSPNSAPPATFVPAHPASRSGGHTMVCAPWLGSCGAQFTGSKSPAGGREFFIEKSSDGCFRRYSRRFLCLTRPPRPCTRPGPRRRARPLLSPRVSASWCARQTLTTAGSALSVHGRPDRGLLLQTTRPGSAARELRARTAAGLQHEGERRRILSVNGASLRPVSTAHGSATGTPPRSN